MTTTIHRRITVKERGKVKAGICTRPSEPRPRRDV